MKQRKRMNDNDADADWVQEENRYTFPNINCIKWQEITINYVNLVCLNLVGGSEKNTTTTTMLMVVMAMVARGRPKYTVLVHLEHCLIPLSKCCRFARGESVYTRHVSATPNIVNRRHWYMHWSNLLCTIKKATHDRRAENGNSIFRAVDEQKYRKNEHKTILYKYSHMARCMKTHLTGPFHFCFLGSGDTQSITKLSYC